MHLRPRAVARNNTDSFVLDVDGLDPDVGLSEVRVPRRLHRNASSMGGGGRTWLGNMDGSLKDISANTNKPPLRLKKIKERGLTLEGMLS